MTRLGFLVALLATLGAFSTAQAQPSYPCGGRLNPAEQTICNDSELARLDVAMANLYTVVMDRFTAQSRQKADVTSARQRDWRLNGRDRCGANRACLNSAYVQQIAILAGELGGQTPRPVEPAPQAADRASNVTIQPDGTLVKVKPDGSKEVRSPDGDVRYYGPDGKENTQRTAAVHVPTGALPDLPSSLSDWGYGLGYDLEKILRNLLSTQEYDAYKQTEAGKPYYDLIDWRLKSISFLTAEP